MRLKISVTQQHIDDGRQDSRGYCPIALAMRGTQTKEGSTLGLIEVFHSHVDLCVFRKDGGHVWVRVVELPTRAVSFVNSFDRSGKRSVKPFSFFAEITEGAK